MSPDSPPPERCEACELARKMWLGGIGSEYRASVEKWPIVPTSVLGINLGTHHALLAAANERAEAAEKERDAAKALCVNEILKASVVIRALRTELAAANERIKELEKSGATVKALWAEATRSAEIVEASLKEAVRLLRTYSYSRMDHYSKLIYPREVEAFILRQKGGG